MTSTTSNTADHEEYAVDPITVGESTGCCKWFSNVHGYGFITTCGGTDGDEGTDVFVHHSGLQPAVSQYKTLYTGEYVTFDVIDGPHGPQATNVRGIAGGKLMCDHSTSSRPTHSSAPTSSGRGRGRGRGGSGRGGGRGSSHDRRDT